MITIAPVPRARLVDAAALAMEAWDRAGDPAIYAAELSRAVVLGAFRGDRLVGVVTATVDGTTARSEETAVASDARGLGIGAALWDALAENLRGLGVEEVLGESSATKIGALGFFRRLGFEVVGAEIAHRKPWFRDGDLILQTRLRLPQLGQNPVIDFTSNDRSLSVD